MFFACFRDFSCVFAYLKASASAAGSLKFEDWRIGGFEGIRILYKFSVNVGTLEAVFARLNRRGRAFP